MARTDPALARPASAGIPLRWIVVPALLAIFLLVLDLAADSDRTLTRLVFDSRAGAFPLRNSFWLDVIMYHWAKYTVITIGFVIVAALCLSYVLPGLRPERRVLVFLALAVTVAPGTVAGVKSVSARQCPWNVDEFGGLVPYARLLEAPQPDIPRGRCFPAGPASTGFALFAFYFAAHARGMRKAARRAFILANAAGLVLGFGLILQGAHFLSDVLWSGLVCWAVMVVLYSVVFWRPTRGGHEPHRAESALVN